MPRLFRRTYRLQVDTLEIEGLNVGFTIERTLRRRPGRCEIKVWNLSADHRSQLETLPAGGVYVRLEAGYDDATGRGQIFEGRLHRARTERSGADLITTIRSRDGGGTTSARTSRSHAAGASVASVVRGLVADLGIGEGNLPDVLDRLTLGGVGSFSAGVAVSGGTADELDGIMDSAGYEWSVQDGAIQVLERGAGLTRPAVLLSPETGLIGRPTVDEHGKIQAETLLIPALVPGALVLIETTDRTGTYRIEQARFRGELDGGDWGVSLTCGVPT